MTTPPTVSTSRSVFTPPPPTAATPVPTRAASSQPDTLGPTRRGGNPGRPMRRQPAVRTERRRSTSAGLLAALAGRLTGRDRWLLAMLAEHRVLTTTHLAALGFAGRRQAERRLAQLWAWRCVDRFRPFIPLGAGSAPYHWVLDDAGAAVLAAGHGIEVRDLGYSRAAALAVAHSEHLAHALGTNALLTALATSSSGGRDGTGAAAGRLVGWWGERRCAATWGDLARPDAAATWSTSTHAVAAGASSATGAEVRMGFAVEYDTGSEPLPRVAAKLADYADLAAAGGAVLPVLFWLPSAARETGLHRHLDATGLMVATAAADHAAHAGGPAGSVWRPAHQGAGDQARRRARVDLDQLTADWAGAGTLPVAAGDLGLAWPAPGPHPPAADPSQPRPHESRWGS
jgi:hypothetical protein